MPTLIRNGIVLPMTGGPAVFDPGSVLVDGDAIVAVGPGHAVIPGLHNCHLHSGLLRGTAESMSLWDWLKTYVDPAHRALTPEIAKVASRQCYAESLGWSPTVCRRRSTSRRCAPRPRPPRRSSSIAGRSSSPHRERRRADRDGRCRALGHRPTRDRDGTVIGSQQSAASMA